MQKKYIGFLLIAVLAITGLVRSVHAEDTATSTNDGKEHQTLQEKVEARKEKIDELRQKMQDHLTQVAEGNGKALGRIMPMKFGDDSEKGLSKKDVINRRFNFATQLIDNLYTRLSNIIDRLSASGTDMTDAKAKLAIAKTKIDAAKQSITDLQTLVAGIKAAAVAPDGTNASIKSTLSDTDRQKIKDDAQKAKEAIKAVKQSFIDVRDSIKTALGITDDQENDNNQQGDTHHEQDGADDQNDN